MSVIGKITLDTKDFPQDLCWTLRFSSLPCLFPHPRELERERERERKGRG
jgi:hypothetical protein